eukprot:Tamp_33855.p1 GENE.Tamp_33855~~Tamp_33855.p1  ORF type:complete len:168 (-),score=37.15 Tamp_33855:62-565(-)
MSDLGGQAFRQERFILGGTAHLDGSPLRFMHQLGNPGVPFHGPPASGGSLGEAAAAQRRAGGEEEPAMQTYHIQVTPVKDKSVSFYVSLAKRALLVHETLELSGTGTAMATTVNISEVLHNSGVATRSRVCTSMETVQEGFGTLSIGEQPGKPVQRPKIQIWMSVQK